MRKIEALQLGGTLFVPAVHKHLETISKREKFPTLRSVVFDTEDGIADDALEAALERIAALLCTMVPSPLLRFIRPRDPETLERLLALPGIAKIDGFVLPKFGLENAEAYLNTVGDYYFMPSIEGNELFDVSKLQQLRDILLPYQKQIILVRFGAEDMLRQLGLRRDCDTLLYDMCVPSQVIANIIMTFKPQGFDIAAPVYRCYSDREGFERELRRDLAEGLLSKTIIHPDQIEPVERVYRVNKKELHEVETLLANEEGVFSQEGTMAEVKTQTPWAVLLEQRSKIYGVR